MSFVVVIPARYQSTRLPGKPLIKIAGESMILRTYKQCIKAVPKELVYIATDDSRIQGECEAAGAQVIMTGVECLTGTDRVAQFSKTVQADHYINVQGDEPLFHPEDLQSLVREIADFPNDVICGYCAITRAEDFLSLSIPKVVMDQRKRLLYMSRAPIPAGKELVMKKGWRQVCAYGFPAAALEAFGSWTQKTELEQIEDIEILRFIENGWSVKMLEMSNESIAVDNPEDIERVEEKLAKLRL